MVLPDGVRRCGNGAAIWSPAWHLSRAGGRRCPFFRSVDNGPWYLPVSVTESVRISGADPKGTVHPVKMAA